jgi:hypothetical protein
VNSKFVLREFMGHGMKHVTRSDSVVVTKRRAAEGTEAVDQILQALFTAAKRPDDDVKHCVGVHGVHARLLFSRRSHARLTHRAMHHCSVFRFLH